MTSLLTFHENPPLSLYIHLPWCIKKCPYCDFNSHELNQLDTEEDNYVDALIRDLDSELPRIWGRTIISIFIGGGTPSLFSVEALEKLFSALRARLNFYPEIEISLEANPGTTDIERFKGYREIGINRLSIGVQSFSNEKLKVLGRIHDADGARNAIEAAKKTGFENINIDLMHGLPGQTIEQALFDIQTAAQFSPEHLSWYQLTIEPNTVFHTRPPTLPQEDMLWEIQSEGQELLSSAGYQQYEISAYAKPKQQCQHNLNYWEFGDYLGIGAGAHGKITNVAESKVERFTRHKIPKRYIELAGTTDIITETRSLNRKDLILEFMMNTMRLIQGVPSHLFMQRTGLPMKLAEKKLKQAEQEGLLDWGLEHIKPTTRGVQYLNDLLAYFVDP